MIDARPFHGVRFPAEVVLWAVRWYLRFPVSYRDLALMLADHGRRGRLHLSPDLAVPPNLILIHLPPYSPKLNPVERLWEYLRERWLSHRVLAGGYQAVVDAACATWNALLVEPGRLRSLTSFPWLPTSVAIS